MNWPRLRARPFFSCVGAAEGTRAGSAGCEAVARLTYRIPPPGAAGMAAVLRRNIEAMRAERAREEAEARWAERLAGRITAFTGSMTFVALHVAAAALWVLANTGALPAIRPFDPTFVILATVASVEALFLSTFVLISQNRSAALAEKRAALDLQINMLSEYEVTRLAKLTTAIARRLGVDEASDAELDEIGRDVAPEAVISELEEAERRSG